MAPNLAKYKEDIKGLITQGEYRLKFLRGENKNLYYFREQYELWYSEALCLVKTLIPDRLEDFKYYYEQLKEYLTYLPPGENLNLDFGEQPPKEIDIANVLFFNQLNIIKACEKRFESSLFDIKSIVRAELFNSELEAARELNKKGFRRGAGAVAGVVLEKHLGEVCTNHKVKINKKKPAINDFNQKLKESGGLEHDKWRFIQHLADLRNKCTHNKEREPTKENVEDLIEGVEKITKTIF